MIPVAEARSRIVGRFAPLPAEIVPLSAAAGRVLAQDVPARLTQPPLAVSAMDGYAVRAADTQAPGARLRVVGEAPAGRPFGGDVGPGETVRIFTGGPVPAGADAILIQENAGREGDSVIVAEPVSEGRYIRPAGLDFAAGEVLLPAGRLLRPRDIGLAAAVNAPWLPVVRRPVVAILATGDEIVLPGDPVEPGQIVSSNSWALAAFVERNGGTAQNLGIAGDDPAALQDAVRGMDRADLLVTTGGASVGEHDLIQAA
ncbi:MAG: molybdopterin molybdotransferase MoeA, partial [Rhodospirillaceae bacterium]|nr:molybdopterin molybdotransferase MoeA [Rhodospirillaceae bacterium]